jgi:hypothetical protein
MQRIRTLYLVILAFFAVAVVEGGLVDIAFSAENQTIAIWGAGVVESVFIIAFVAYALADQLGWNLRKLTADPLRAWIFLHAIYWLAGVLNGIILYGLFLYIMVGGKFSSNWILVMGSNFVFALAANFLVMRALGQEYQSLRGSCLTGAASFARLARGMIERKNRYGINQLMLSMRMARGMFRGLSFVPHRMDAAAATLVTLRETGSWSVETLSLVAQSLEELPKLDSLPGAFKNFLDMLGWPGGFDVIDPPRRYSDYPKLTILFTAVLSVAAVAALFSDLVRQGVLQILGNFAIQNSLVLVGALALLIDFVLVVRTISWPVPFLALRYWPREKATTLAR